VAVLPTAAAVAVLPTAAAVADTAAINLKSDIRLKETSPH
jgi:hypothetical protein